MACSKEISKELEKCKLFDVFEKKKMKKKKNQLI